MPTRRSVAAPRSMILNVRDSDSHGLKKCEHNLNHGSFCMGQKSLDSLPSEKIMFCGLISLCTIPVE